MTKGALFSRRAALVTTAFAFLGSALPGRANAVTAESSVKLLQSLITEINNAAKRVRTDAELLRELEAILTKYSDIPSLARSALGVAWRTATDEQKRQFIGVYGGYLARKYVETFRDFTVARVSVSGTQAVRGGFLINSIIKLQTGTFYSIDWQVADIYGQDKMVNMVIEGISLLSSQRTDIADKLDSRKGDLDRLIADLPGLG